MMSVPKCTEFRLDNLILEYGKPHNFVYTQCRPKGHQYAFLAWRVVTAVYFSIWFIVSFLSGASGWAMFKWFIYLTHWAYLVHLLCCWWNVVTLVLYGNIHSRYSSDAPDYMTGDLKICWILNNVSPVFNMGVTIGYWFFLYKPGETEVDAVTLHTHGINALYSVIDILICSRPVRLLHVYQAMLAGAAYIMFSAFYYFMGGTNKKNQTYIYPITDWSKPARTAAFVVLFLFLIVPLFHFSHWVLYKIRRCCCTGRCYGGKKKRSVLDLESSQQLATDKTSKNNSQQV